MELSPLVKAVLKSDGLPEELRKMILDFGTALEEKAEPLDSTPEGQDVISLLDDIGRDFSLELSIFARTVGAARYHARLFVYGQEKKGKRQQWVRTATHFADPEFLTGGLDLLRTLMREMMGRQEGKSIAIWVAPVAAMGREALVLYFLHKEGFETVFTARERGFVPMDMGAGPLNMTLESMLSPSSRTKDKWAGLVAAQRAHMGDVARDDVAALWQKHSGTPLTDEVWDELLTAIYVRADYLHMLQEVTRALGDSQTRESQRLLESMVTLVDQALEGNKEKMANIEKNNERARKRFMTDLAMFKSERDVARKRTKQLEREALALRKQIQAAGSGQGAQAASHSVGLALDRFFL